MSKSPAPSKHVMRNLTRTEYLMQKYPFISTSKIHDLRQIQSFSIFFTHPCFVHVTVSSFDDFAAVYVAGEGRFIHKKEYNIHSNTFFRLSYEQFEDLAISTSYFKFSQSSIVAIDADDFEDAVFRYIYRKADICGICETFIYNPSFKSRDDGLLDVHYVSSLFLPRPV